MGQKELLPIYILQILQEHADAEHRLKQAELLRLLDENYNISVSRRTLSKYIDCLRNEGFVQGNRGVYKANEFSDTELRLLIDGVLFGQHVPTAEAKTLIEKLKGMSGASLKNRVKHVHYLEGIQHTDNSELCRILDILDSAIEHHKKVELTQCTYDINGHLQRHGTSIVSPYYIVPSRSMYYLICYASRGGDVENRRLDRICDVRILSEPRDELSNIANYKQCPFNLSNYIKEHIYMFSGACDRIVMRVDKKAIGDVIDWYGKDYRILEQTEDSVTIRLYANCNAVYYWALQYGEKVEILKPASLRERIREGLREMLKRYEEER